MAGPALVALPDSGAGQIADRSAAGILPVNTQAGQASADAGNAGIAGIAGGTVGTAESFGDEVVEHEIDNSENEVVEDSEIDNFGEEVVDTSESEVVDNSESEAADNSESEAAASLGPFHTHYTSVWQN